MIYILNWVIFLECMVLIFVFLVYVMNCFSLHKDVNFSLFWDKFFGAIGIFGLVYFLIDMMFFYVPMLFLFSELFFPSLYYNYFTMNFINPVMDALFETLFMYLGLLANYCESSKYFYFFYYGFIIFFLFMYVKSIFFFISCDSFVSFDVHKDYNFFMFLYLVCFCVFFYMFMMNSYMTTMTVMSGLY